MISVEEALAACLALSNPVGEEAVPLAGAGGRVLTRSVHQRHIFVMQRRHKVKQQVLGVGNSNHFAS
jgi:hypothetical protein